jgi:hypothetical protein
MALRRCAGPDEVVRTHPFAPDGRQRPGKTPVRTAVSPRYLIRMRSQVQVLAGPPLIVAGQSAAGSGPGAFAVGLGRAGAARPSPPAHPLVPPGPPTRPAGPATTTHRGRAPSPRTPARWRMPPPRAATCSRAHSAAARDGRSARRPGLPGRSAGKRGRRPHPTGGPGPPPTSHRPTRLGQCRPRPSLLDRRPSRRRPGSRRGPHPSCGHGRPATSTWFPTPPPEHGRRRTRPDGRGQTPDGWTPEGWTADGRAPDPLEDDPR